MCSARSTSCNGRSASPSSGAKGMSARPNGCRHHRPRLLLHHLLYSETVKRELNYLDSCAPTALVKHMLNESSLNHAFQALSDPTRRTMLSRLARGPASVSELAAPLAMSLPAVLQHLKALEESGLVSTAKKGRVRTARLEGNAIAEAEQWLTDRRTEREAHADRLESFIATPQEHGE